MLGYLGTEFLVSTLFEVAIFMAWVLIYWKLKVKQNTSNAKWILVCRRAVGFMVLSVALPVLIFGLGLLILGDDIDHYAAVITLVSYSLPMACALFYFYKLAKIDSVTKI